MRVRAHRREAHTSCYPYGRAPGAPRGRCPRVHLLAQQATTQPVTAGQRPVNAVHAEPGNHRRNHPVTVESSGTGEAPRAPSVAADAGSPGRRAGPVGRQARAPAHASSSTPRWAVRVGGSAGPSTRRYRCTVPWPEPSPSAPPRGDAVDGSMCCRPNPRYATCTCDATSAYRRYPTSPAPSPTVTPGPNGSFDGSHTATARPPWRVTGPSALVNGVSFTPR